MGEVKWKWSSWGSNKHIQLKRTRLLLLSWAPKAKSQQNNLFFCSFFPWLVQHVDSSLFHVSVQENFELNHETLYLAVKMTDHYLSLTPVHREMLQLVGSTAMLIASKFEVRTHSTHFRSNGSLSAVLGCMQPLRRRRPLRFSSEDVFERNEMKSP